MKNKVSVVITSYRDRGHLWNVINQWMSFGITVYLADAGKSNTGPEHRYMKYFHHYLYNPDPGNKIRFATASLTTTPYVILADDDVMPKPGLIEDFLKYHQGGFSGIIGKQFTNDDYRKCPFFRADKIDKPVEVGFVGVIYFVHRDFIKFDLSKLNNRAVDDLYWQMECFPKAKKFVIPTKNYENLPECNDKESIFKTPESRAYREKWYKNKYNEVNK